jgi:hypothetical protein
MTNNIRLDHTLGNPGSFFPTRDQKTQDKKGHIQFWGVLFFETKA